VRIAVHRDAVGAHRRDRVERLVESGRGLLRQPVDQVHVDRAESAGAAGIDHRTRLLDALDAVDRDLHGRVEVLHAETGAVEPDGGQLGDIVRRDEARVDLDGDVAVGGIGEMELPAQRVHDLAQLRRRQEVGRAAAEVQLDDFAIAVEQLRGEVDLAVQPRQVAVGTGRIAGDDAVAAAVEARAHAERHVDVQRQPARDRISIAGDGGLPQFSFAEMQVELRRRRIRGVARARPVVAAQQVGFERKA
jgi:hypothetical protein